MHQIVDCPNSTSSKSNSILEYKTEICKCHLGPKFHHKPVPLGQQPFQFINHAIWGEQSSKLVQMYQHPFQFKVIPYGANKFHHKPVPLGQQPSQFKRTLTGADTVTRIIILSVEAIGQTLSNDLKNLIPRKWKFGLKMKSACLSIFQCRQRKKTFLRYTHYSFELTPPDCTLCVWCHMDIIHTTHHNFPVLHNLSIYRGEILDRGAEPHRYTP